MDSALETQSRTAGKNWMLCPCCGDPIPASIKECSCGARFVGRPLDDEPIRVQRLGPAITSVLLLLLVITLSLTATKWFALGAVVVVWAARRAALLARRDPDWHGGYRVALATLIVTTIAGVVSAAIALSHGSQYFENYRIRQEAATRASMHRIASLLEDYKATCGSFPKDAEEIKKALGETLPADFWDKRIKYQSSSALAENEASPLRMTGLQMANFELRSSGPDGIDGTDDDIVMLDGVFLTAAEARKQAAPTRPPIR